MVAHPVKPALVVPVTPAPTRVSLLVAVIPGAGVATSAPGARQGLRAAGHPGVVRTTRVYEVGVTAAKTGQVRALRVPT